MSCCVIVQVIFVVIAALQEVLWVPICSITGALKFAHMWKRVSKILETLSLRTFLSQLKQQPERMARNASVRLVGGEERLQISFVFGLDGGKERVYNFDRLKSEEVQTTIERMETNISKKAFTVGLKKRMKKAMAAVADGDAANAAPVLDTTVKVSLLHNGSYVDPDVPNTEAWIEGATLKVGDLKYEVCVNLPNVRSMKLPESILSGFPTYPKIDAEFVNLDECKFSWYKKRDKADGGKCQEDSPMDCACDGDRPSGSPGGVARKKQRLSASDAEDEKEWQQVNTGYCYMPSSEDIGSPLRVVCLPTDDGRFGEASSAVSKFPVSAGPGYCPFERRHLFTQEHAGDKW